MSPVKSPGRTMLPKGMATLLPEATAFRRGLERAAFDVFRLWGYEEIITPLFEYLDVISPGLGPGLAEKAYTVTDRASGRVMVLRPDITPQIARIAAMLFRDAPRPLRLCYGANVFRYEDEHAGHEREIFQLGAELIGPSHPAADVEIVALAVSVLERFGLDRATVTVGHVGFFQGWLAETGVSHEYAVQLEEAVVKKDRTRVMEALRQAGRSAADVARLVKLLDLIGGEDVLDRAEKLVDHPGCRVALAYLREVLRHARRHGLSKTIVLDLAEIRSREYYSGLVFELFADGVGYEIGRGGRYDDLIGRFGAPSPSTGFAIHLERLQQALDLIPSAARYGAADVLVEGAGGDRNGLGLARRLRRQGVKATMWLAGAENTPEEYARALNIPWIIRAGFGSNVTLTEAKTLRTRRLSPAAAARAILGRRGVQKG